MGMGLCHGHEAGDSDDDGVSEESESSLGSDPRLPYSARCSDHAHDWTEVEPRDVV